MTYEFLDLGDLSCADIVRKFNHLLKHVPENFQVIAFCSFGLPIGQYEELDFERDAHWTAILNSIAPWQFSATVSDRRTSSGWYRLRND
jgi:hypothetical protein